MRGGRRSEGGRGERSVNRPELNPLSSCERMFTISYSKTSQICNGYYL
jgi:hypothetical protein